MGASSSNPVQTVPEVVKLDSKNVSVDQWSNSTQVTYDTSLSDDLVRAEVQKAFEAGFSAGLESHKHAVQAQVLDENNQKIRQMQNAAAKQANEIVSRTDTHIVNLQT